MQLTLWCFQNLDRVWTGSRESLDGETGSWDEDVDAPRGETIGGRGGFWWLLGGLSFPAGVCHSSSKERQLGISQHSNISKFNIPLLSKIKFLGSEIFPKTCLHLHLTRNLCVHSGLQHSCSALAAAKPLLATLAPERESNHS